MRMRMAPTLVSGGVRPSSRRRARRHVEYALLAQARQILRASARGEMSARCERMKRLKCTPRLEYKGCEAVTAPHAETRTRTRVGVGGHLHLSTFAHSRFWMPWWSSTPPAISGSSCRSCMNAYVCARRGDFARQVASWRGGPIGTKPTRPLSATTNQRRTMSAKESRKASSSKAFEGPNFSMRIFCHLAPWDEPNVVSGKPPYPAVTSVILF